MLLSLYYYYYCYHIHIYILLTIIIIIYIMYYIIIINNNYYYSYKYIRVYIYIYIIYIYIVYLQNRSNPMSYVYCPQPGPSFVNTSRPKCSSKLEVNSKAVGNCCVIWWTSCDAGNPSGDSSKGWMFHKKHIFDGEISHVSWWNNMVK